MLEFNPFAVRISLVTCARDNGARTALHGTAGGGDEYAQTCAHEQMDIWMDILEPNGNGCVLECEILSSLYTVPYAL